MGQDLEQRLNRCQVLAAPLSMGKWSLLLLKPFPSHI